MSRLPRPWSLPRPRALTLLLALALPLAACGGDDGDAATTTSTAPTTTAAPPSTTEPPGEPVDPAVLAVGDCFEDRVIAGQGETDIDETQTVVVDCEDPHRNEVFLVAEMPDEGTGFPGVDAVTDHAEETCLAAFEPFIGLEYVLSEFEIGFTMPSEDSWLLADRRITCFVFDRSGDKTSGSAAGTAR